MLSLLLLKACVQFSVLICDRCLLQLVYIPNRCIIIMFVCLSCRTTRIMFLVLNILFDFLLSFMSFLVCFLGCVFVCVNAPDAGATRAARVRYRTASRFAALGMAAAAGDVRAPLPGRRGAATAAGAAPCGPPLADRR